MPSRLDDLMTELRDRSRLPSGPQKSPQEGWDEQAIMIWTVDSTVENVGSRFVFLHPTAAHG
jgi:hypothetical protein